MPVDEQGEAEAEGKFGRHREGGEEQRIEQRVVELVVGQQTGEVSEADEGAGRGIGRVELLERDREHIDGRKDGKGQQNQHGGRQQQIAQIFLDPALQSPLP